MKWSQKPNDKGQTSEKTRQLKLPFDPPIKGDVCCNCSSVMKTVCNLCRHCEGCGHVRGCEGEFVEVE